MPGRINGFSLGYTAAGGIVLWSGITGQPLSTVIRGLLKGQAPQQAPAPVSQTTAADTAIGAASGGTTVPGAVTSIQNYGLAQMVAGTYGWAGGPEFAALTNVISRESGGNPNAVNPTSGAYGIAQALGHGTAATAGTVTNQYGGYGVPDSTCIAANSGNASAQLVWMCAYIKSAYGDPIAAWHQEQTGGYY